MPDALDLVAAELLIRKSLEDNLQPLSIRVELYEALFIDGVQSADLSKIVEHLSRNLAQALPEIISTATMAGEEQDICGLCGQPGADKQAHPVYWPGERRPDGPLVHAACEDEECRRAHAALTTEQRRRFLCILGR